MDSTTSSRLGHKAAIKTSPLNPVLNCVTCAMASASPHVRPISPALSSLFFARWFFCRPLSSSQLHRLMASLGPSSLTFDSLELVLFFISGCFVNRRARHS